MSQLNIAQEIHQHLDEMRIGSMELMVGQQNRTKTGQTSFLVYGRYNADSRTPNIYRVTVEALT